MDGSHFVPGCVGVIWYLGQSPGGGGLLVLPQISVSNNQFWPEVIYTSRMKTQPIIWFLPTKITYHPTGKHKIKITYHKALSTKIPIIRLSFPNIFPCPLLLTLSFFISLRLYFYLGINLVLSFSELHLSKDAAGQEEE